MEVLYYLSAINLVVLVPSMSLYLSYLILECHANKVVVYFLFPETESLRLEAIHDIFLDSKHVFQPVSAARNLKHARRQGAHGELQVDDKATEEHKEVV